MVSSPITSWQTEGETIETVTGFIFLASKMTADDDWGYEIKRCLHLERKAMTNLDSILKGRDITLPTKVHKVKAMFFPVVMYGCERWTIKKAECQRIDAFELWCGRRLLRVPWTAKRSNQSVLKEINPEYSLAGLMMKLKLQHFCHLMQRTDSYSDAGQDWRQEEKGGTEGEMVASATQWIWVWANSRRWWRTGKLCVLQSMGLQRVGHGLVTEQKWLNESKQ